MKYNLGQLSLLLGCVTLLGACQSLPREESTDLAPNLESIEASLQGDAESRQPSEPVPEAVEQALLPPVEIPLPRQAGPVERRFDIAVTDIPAREFFLGLVKDTAFNMVVHPDVTGSLSLDLKNVTVDEVMQTIRDVYGYEYQRKGNVYQVLPARMRSRIFKIDYLNVRREGSSRTRVSSGQVSDAPAAGADSGSGQTGTSTGSASTSGSNEAAGGTVSGSEVNTHSESDFWKELRTALEMLIGEEDGRRVVVNPQAGILVVRALPGELRDVADYLRTMQDVIQRQVILEAKIVEVELNDRFQTGINWGALGEPGEGKTLFGSQAGGGSIFNDDAAEFQDMPVSIAPDTGLTGVTTSSFGGVFLLSANLNDFSAFLEVLKTQGKVQVLSSPRVSTVNNQKAVIKVGTDEFFVTDVETDTNTTDNTTNQSVNVALTPFFSGVALDVIPQINDDNEVILHIHPTVSEVTERTKSINVSTQTTLEVPLALSSIRESDTIIRAQSGQIVVIGGLMKDQRRNDVAKTPGLGDLPVVGGMFRHQRETMTKSELVILLRPIVTNGGRSWERQLGAARERIRRLDAASTGPGAAQR